MKPKSEKTVHTREKTKEVFSKKGFIRFSDTINHKFLTTETNSKAL